MYHLETVGDGQTDGHSTAEFFGGHHIIPHHTTTASVVGYEKQNMDIRYYT